MGADESKSVGSSGGASFASTTVDFPNSCRRESDAVAWTLLHQTTVDKWKEGHAEACNFSETTLACEGGLRDCSKSFCIERQGFVNVSKASTIFSFRKRSKFYKMAEHFEYNHIPAQMSSVNHFRVNSVLCFRDTLVVLHLSHSKQGRDELVTDQLGILDLKVNKFMGVFAKFQCPYSISDRLMGALSPDKTKCLVRLPHKRNPQSHDMLQLFDIKTRTLQMEINLFLIQSTHFAFDPRFHWQRVAITNYAGPGVNNSISTVQLEVSKVAQSADEDAVPGNQARFHSSHQALHSNHRLSDTRAELYPYMRDLQYTRDGSLLVATLLDSDCHCRHKSTRNYRPVGCSIYVLNGETVETLHCIQFQRYTCVTHACPINYTPVFSDCGSRLAVTMNVPDQVGVHYVQIYKMPHVVNLQNMCRVAIRQNFPGESLTDLPLPVRLINSLYFKPEY